ncbi:para-nitrobenzyl esterase [Mycobacterium tuberculosis RGTB327]|nr:para-nitrobenzyl esterase [Mycobacterium tuberculosis RGTB327]
MFTQIAAEQPDLQVPTEEQIGSAYSRWRRKARSLSMATDVGFRMPSVWLAEGHSGVAPVYLYRFDYSTPLLKLLLVRAAHATELPYVWGNLGGIPGPCIEVGRRQSRHSGVPEGTDAVDQFRDAGQTHGSRWRARLAMLRGGPSCLPDYRQARRRRARRRRTHPSDLGQQVVSFR